MGSIVLAVLSTVFAAQQDSIRTFATPATEAVVTRASERFHIQDTLVDDYTAALNYRLTVAQGNGRWQRALAGAVEEQQARVHWSRPNDLRVDVIGRRYQSRSPELELSSVFDRPWFVPRGVGDSVRLFSDDFPATGALHPLGRGAFAAYHYDLTDSLSVVLPDGRNLRLYSVNFIPKRVAPALVAGRLWIDAASFEVVRFTFRYVGEGLWEQPDGGTTRDSAAARRTNRFISRVLTIDADLEYGLQDGRYWMPYRQSIAGTIRIPLANGAIISFHAVTTFRDYQINTGQPIQFVLPMDSLTGRERREARRDSLQAEREGRARDERSYDYAGRWPGGRYEVHRPSNDSLSRYDAWTDSLRVSNDADDELRIREMSGFLEELAEELPGDLTGQRAFSIGFERMGDAFGYNRVQGVSLGAGIRLSVPGVSFTDLFLTGRYGFSDQRGSARAGIVRDAPGAKVTLAGFRDIVDADPFSAGRTLGNSANALFTAHDNADYFLATGARADVTIYAAPGLDVTVGGGYQRERSTPTEARSAVNNLLGGDGYFPPNPDVAEGDFGRASLRVDRFGKLRWTLVADGLTGADVTAGRVYGEVKRGWGGARGMTIRLKVGIASSEAPPQTLFRLGGMQTVRGFQYGTARGTAFWAGQLDVSPLKGSIRPVLFLDAGQAGTPGTLFDNEALIGGGVGVSLYSPLLRTTLIRFDLSHPLSNTIEPEWRFDLVFSPVR